MPAFVRGRVENRLDELGPGLSGLTDVFITHGHGDHVAVLSQLDNA
jgi:glyoxylase-like metal-dependent hydrolase (beta-lactamase superfamily II)